MQKPFELRCAWRGCRRKRIVLPQHYARTRKYCSRQCYAQDHAPAWVRCQVCRERFRAPSWRKRQFCSSACTYRGRQRTRNPIYVERDARILELFAAGVKKAPAIAEALRQDTRCVEGPEGAHWRVSNAMVRQVLSAAHRAD